MLKTNDHGIKDTDSIYKNVESVYKKNIAITNTKKIGNSNFHQRKQNSGVLVFLGYFIEGFKRL